MSNLENYVFTESQRDQIQWDQYSRPYIQDPIGRLMLSKRSSYHYTIAG